MVIRIPSRHRRSTAITVNYFSKGGGVCGFYPGYSLLGVHKREGEEDDRGYPQSGLGRGPQEDGGVVSGEGVAAHSCAGRFYLTTIRA